MSHFRFFTVCIASLGLGFITAGGCASPTRNTSGTAGSGSPGSAGNGTYQVIFDRDVTGCAYTGTIGGPTNVNQPGEISVGQRSGNANGVFVITYNSAGTGADLPFFVAVHC